MNSSTIPKYRGRRRSKQAQKQAQNKLKNTIGVLSKASCTASCMASCMSHSLRGKEGKDIRSQGSRLAEIHQLQDENVVLNRIVPYRIASLRVYHVYIM